MAKRSVLMGAGIGALLLVGAVLWFALAPMSGPRTGTGDAPASAKSDATTAASSSRAPSAALLGGSVLGRTVRGNPAAPVAATFRVEGLDGPAREASGDADGTFFISDLPRERDLELQVSAPGTAMLRVPIRIPASGPLDLGDLELGGAVPVDVLVTDTAGTPVKGAALELHKATTRVPGGDWARVQFSPFAPGTPAASASTAADGRARLTGAPPGAYFLVTRAQGFALAANALHLRESAARSTERIVLQPSVTLTGRVLGPGDVPMPGVAVWADPGNLWSAPSASRVQVMSDEKGAYRLDGLSAGSFTLKARTIANVFYTLPTIELPALLEYDIRLHGAAMVRGLVTDEVSGAPVAGAAVTLSAYNQETGAQNFAIATSDAEGRFVIAGLPRSTWASATVRAEGYTTGALEMGSAPILEDGGALEGIARLRKGVTLKGRVLDETGKVVAGATVEGRQWVPRHGSQYPGRAITTAEGAFTIESVPLGVVLLRVTAPGYHQPDYPADEWQAMQQGNTPESYTVTVTADAPTVKDLVLQTAAGVSGVVTGEDGAPREGMTVSITSRTGGGGGGGGAPTDAEGRFHLTSVAPSEVLVATARGPDGLIGESDPFALVSGGSATGVRVTVRAGGTVAGRVSREDGGALTGTVVKHFAGKSDPTQPWNTEWQRRLAVTTPVAADGSFRIEGLVTRELTIFANAPDAGPAPDVVVKLERSENRSGVDLLLPRERILSGRALDAEGKGVAGAEILVQILPAVGDASMAMMNPGPGSIPVAALSAADGLFRIGGLGASRYSVIVRAFGLQEARETVDLSREGTEIQVTLKSGLAIAGTITEQDGGAPIEGVIVQAHPQLNTGGAWRQHQARSDATGRFRIRSVPEGEYVVLVGGAWGAEPSPWVPDSRSKIAAGTEDLIFSLRPGLSISGSIQTEDGAATSGVMMVEAITRKSDGTTDHARQRSAQSRNDGTFEVSGLEAGIYDLLVNPQGMGGKGAAFAIARVNGVVAGSRDVVFRLRTGVALTGRVVNPDGAALKGRGQLSVRVSGTQEIVASGRSGTDGTFTFAALDPETSYDIEATGYPGTAGGTARGVRPGASDIVLTLDRGGILSGRVVDAKGVPVEAGVPVAAWAIDRQGAGTNANALTDAKGSFTLSGLGDHEFRLTVGGGTSAYVPMASKEMWRIGATDVVITVEVGVEITGHIVDANGNATQPRWLMATPKAGGAPSNAQPAADGSFRLRGLRPGAYTLAASTGNGQVALGEHEAPATGVELRLK